MDREVFGAGHGHRGESQQLFAPKVFHRFVKPSFRSGVGKGHLCALDANFEQLDRVDEDEDVRAEVNDRRLNRADPAE